MSILSNMDCNRKGFMLVSAICLVIVITAFFLLAFYGTSSGQGGKLSPEVQALCDDFWNWRITDLPEFATFVGIHDYNDRLDDLSLEAFDARLAQVEIFLERVGELEVGLTEHEDIVNVRVLRDELETFRDGYQFKNFYVALSNKEGLQVDLLRLLSWMPLETEADYTTLLARLQKIPAQVDQIIALLTSGVEAGITLHERSFDKVSGQVEAFVVLEPTASPIYEQFFASLPAGVPSSVQDEAQAIIGEQVTPAFQQLLEYVTTSYVTRPDIAVTSLPSGTELYAQIIKFHTGSTSSPEEIQQMGYEEVARIEVLMQEIVYEMNYNMTTQEFSSMIRDDPNNYYTTEEDLLNAFRYIVYNITTPAVPMIFKNIPSIPIQVVADPSGTGAFYLTGSYDGARPGVFYVGTQDLNSQAKYTMLTLSLHEGNPGHHLQGSHAIESPTMPFFRSVMEDRNYGHAPSRFPIRAFYLEGWGLYAESTGFDMALYSDPLERYGHYSDEIFRACRLVVDTGMHALGWSRDEAIDFLLLHTAMSRLDVENEVDRYITWPGQALSYKTGQLQLSQFRANAEQQLGELFDLKDFHDVVLESVGPMEVVGEEVDEWVQSVLSPH